MAVRKVPKKSEKSTAAATGFTEEERSAMRERASELKKARPNSQGNKEDGERAVLEKIAAMSPSDRRIGERLHAIVQSTAPDLKPRLWYGMPAYARDGNVVCFFQDSQKFKTRYATLGFSDKAQLDDGQMWPTSFAIRELTTAEESRIAALIRKAVS
jgi:uncharacterized protein YdhG (YjbR/CyaY superfamily)